jgi:hypothetical protein
MLVEPAADHLSVLRPGVIGVERRVNADKSLAVFLDERHHVLFLAVVQVQLAGGAGKHQHVEVVQVLGVVLQGFLVSSSVSVRRVVSQRPLSLPML